MAFVDCNLPRPREHLSGRRRGGASAPWRQNLEVKIVPDTIIALDLVDAVYLMSLLSDHPRSIDRYIDYFGSGTSDLALLDDGQEI